MNTYFSAETLILTTNGLQTVEQIKNNIYDSNPVMVFGIDGNEIKQKQINKILISEKPCNKISLKQGRSFVIVNNNALIDAKPISIDELYKLNLDYNNFEEKIIWSDDFGFDFDPNYIGNNGRVYNTKLPIKWDADLAIVIGWLIGDGWLTKHGIGLIFGNDDMEMYDIITNILKSWDLHGVEVDRGQNSITVYYSNKRLKELMIRLGVKEVLAGKKRIPVSLFKTSKNIQQKFLSSLFSADGSVIKGNNKNKTNWIAYYSKSQQLINDIQNMLCSMGILNSTSYLMDRKKRFKYTKKDGTEVEYEGGSYYDLRISGKSIEEFNNKIGLLMKRKQKTLDDIMIVRNYRERKKTTHIKTIEQVGEIECFSFDIDNIIVGGLTFY